VTKLGDKSLSSKTIVYIVTVFVYLYNNNLIYKAVYSHNFRGTVGMATGLATCR